MKITTMETRKLFINYFNFIYNKFVWLCDRNLGQNFGTIRRQRERERGVERREK